MICSYMIVVPKLYLLFLCIFSLKFRLNRMCIHVCSLAFAYFVLDFVLICLSNQVCTAFSSQIYNLTQNIQEDDLQHLQVHLRTFMHITTVYF